MVNLTCIDDGLSTHREVCAKKGNSCARMRGFSTKMKGKLNDLIAPFHNYPEVKDN